MSSDRRGMARRVFLPVLVASLVALVGCFKPGQAINQPPISISILQTVATLATGQSTTISATVYDQSGQGVTWSFAPLNFGALSNQAFDATTMTATVTYTAPSYLASPTTVTITATSITNPNVASSVSIHFSPITISLQSILDLPLAPQTVNPNDQVAVTAVVSNDTTNAGVTWGLSPATGNGSLSGSSTAGTTYVAPASVTAATNVIVTAASVTDPLVTASANITVLPSGGGPNVVMLNVNGGPVPGQVYSNGAFTSVTICNAGSTTACQTVDGILVDTGSYGLRILQSEIPMLKLSTFTDQLGNTLENCASWPDGSFLWGSVSKADVYIGGESASSQTGSPLPIQVISSTLGIVPSGCSNGGTSNYTPQLLGANGILGIGPEPTDCTLSGVNYCDGSSQSTPPNLYYACPSTGCSASASPVLIPAQLQVSNPIAMFAEDRNGFAMQLPAVSDPQASLTGTLTFGIGTEANNNLGSATVYTLDANDDFTTVFNGQSLTHSYIDSGSIALFFPDSLPACATHTNLYCPSSTTNLNATITGATEGQATVDFTVDNADTLFATYGGDAVFGNIAGPAPASSSCSNGSCIFDWGFPFFYGRTVYAAIDGQGVPSSAPNPPWWAY